jgi:hypothetical protein
MRLVSYASSSCPPARGVQIHVTPAAVSQFGKFCAFNKTKCRDQTAARNGGNLAPIASDLLTQFGIAVPAAPGFSQVIALIPYARDTFNRYRAYVDRILKGDKPADLPRMIPGQTHQRAWGR